MKKRTILAAAAALTCLLSGGCTQIKYDTPPIANSTSTGSAQITENPSETEADDKSVPDKYQVKEVNINEESFSETIQLEEVCDN